MSSTNQKYKFEIVNANDFFNNFTAKTALFLGFLIAFAIVSLVLNIILLKIVLKKSSVTDNASNTVSTTTNTATQQQQQPSQTLGAIQNFTITTNDHVRGSSSAKVTMVEYSDFECPYCGKFHPTLKQVLKDYGDKVRLVYKHFPLGFHANAQIAAEASECASEQGKFWEYHDKIFDNQQSLSQTNLKQWAKDLKLNTTKFNNCLENGTYKNKILADYQDGTARGINGTPGTFINGQLISGAVPYNSLKQVIDQILGS